MNSILALPRANVTCAAEHRFARSVLFRGQPESFTRGNWNDQDSDSSRGSRDDGRCRGRGSATGRGALGPRWRVLRRLGGRRDRRRCARLAVLLWRRSVLRRLWLLRRWPVRLRDLLARAGRDAVRLALAAGLRLRPGIVGRLAGTP